MLNLNTIANETVAEIFTYLSIKDLLAVSRVCKRFQAISDPHLYRSAPLGRLCDFTSPRPHHNFIRTILTRPILASYVQSIQLWCGETADPIDPIPPTEHDLTLLAAATRNLEHPWLESESTQLTLLLHLLPNLRILNLRTSIFHDGIDPFLAQQAFVPTVSLPAGLTHLREIRYQYHAIDTPPQSLLTMLNLPSIRKIYFYSNLYADQLDLISDACIGKSTVTDLHLEHRSMSTLALTRVLSMPRALAHFTYMDRGGNIMDYGEFRKALAASRNTLQYLRVDLLTMSTREPDVKNERKSIGSLYDWPVLRTIWCPMDLLLGERPETQTPRLVDVLPTVIEDFCVGADEYWGTSDVAGKLVELVKGKVVFGPESLVRVAMVINPGEVCGREDVLRAECNTGGVTFELVRIYGMKRLAAGGNV